MKSDDIVGYTYDTETLCPQCTLESVVLNPDLFDSNIEKALDQVAETLGIDRQDEKTFDSNSFPKVIFEVQVESSEEKCDHCGESLVG